MQMESNTLGKFLPAFKKAQMQFEAAKKCGTNPHFKSKYATLEAVLEACKEPLNEHGIVIMQPIIPHDGCDYVVTKLLHESGEWMASASRLTPDRAGPQAYGSYITYLRRYQLSALTGLATEDDDGEAAQSTYRSQPAAKAITRPKQPRPTVTATQASHLEELIKDDQDKKNNLRKFMVEHCGEYDLSKLPLDTYKSMVVRLEAEAVA